MRRTLDRSQRAKQKPNRWSWGGSLQPSTPSAAAGNFTFSSRVHWCFPMSEIKKCLCASIVLFSDALSFIVTADSALPLHLFLLLPFALGSPLCSTIVLYPRCPGFVESAFRYPLDLAGLEHVQSAFSLYHRYGMTSQCEYNGTLT